MGETNTIEKAAEMAQQEAQKIEASKEKGAKDQGSKSDKPDEGGKKDPEARGAGEGDKPEEKTKGSKEPESKQESGKKSDDAEKQAQKDTELLDKKDEELSDEEKERKAEILKGKEPKKEESAEEKLKKWQENTQKRIDMLMSELKAERARGKQDAEKIAALEGQLTEQRTELDKTQGKSPEDLAKKNIEEQNAKYLEEDKDKPREERREIDKEELDEWFMEDPAAATEWIQERTLRRHKDKEAEIEKLTKKEGPKKPADDVQKQQKESFNKLVGKFPEIGEMVKKGQSLLQEGKSRQEVDQILSKESEQYSLFSEVLGSDEKFLKAPNGPELVMQEMTKRLSDKNEKETYSAEEVEKMKQDAIEAERQRLEQVDTGAGTSTAGAGSKGSSKMSKDPMYQEGLKHAVKAGMTAEQYESSFKRNRELQARNPRK